MDSEYSALTVHRLTWALVEPAGSAHSPRGRTIEGRGREQLDSNKIYECADGDCYIGEHQSTAKQDPN